MQNLFKIMSNRLKLCTCWIGRMPSFFHVREMNKSNLMPSIWNMVHSIWYTFLLGIVCNIWLHGSCLDRIPKIFQGGKLGVTGRVIESQRFFKILLKILQTFYIYLHSFTMITWSIWIAPSWIDLHDFIRTQKIPQTFHIYQNTFHICLVYLDGFVMDRFMGTNRILKIDLWDLCTCWVDFVNILNLYIWCICISLLCSFQSSFLYIWSHW